MKTRPTQVDKPARTKARGKKKASCAMSLEQLKSNAVKMGIKAGHAGYCCGCIIRW
jgi:hypothetical protein